MEHDWKTTQTPSRTRHHGDVRTWRCKRCGASVTISTTFDHPSRVHGLGGVDPDCDVEITKRVMKS